MKKMLFLFTAVLLVLCSTVFALEEFARSKIRCGIENCHGLDIICGENVPEACTAMYKFGDRCRQYVRCEIVDEECILIEDRGFKECKLCVQKCQEAFKGDMIKGFECESQCGQQKEYLDED